MRKFIYFMSVVLVMFVSGCEHNVKDYNKNVVLSFSESGINITPTRELKRSAKYSIDIRSTESDYNLKLDGFSKNTKIKLDSVYNENVEVYLTYDYNSNDYDTLQIGTDSHLYPFEGDEVTGIDYKKALQYRTPNLYYSCYYTNVLNDTMNISLIPQNYRTIITVEPINDSITTLIEIDVNGSIYGLASTKTSWLYLSNEYLNDTSEIKLKIHVYDNTTNELISSYKYTLTDKNGTDNWYNYKVLLDEITPSKETTRFSL